MSWSKSQHKSRAIGPINRATALVESPVRSPEGYSRALTITRAPSGTYAVYVFKGSEDAGWRQALESGPGAINRPQAITASAGDP